MVTGKTWANVEIHSLVTTGIWYISNLNNMWNRFISVTHTTYHHSFGACTVERDISAPQEAYLTCGDSLFNLGKQAHALKEGASLQHILLYNCHLLQQHIKLWYMTLHILRLLWAQIQVLHKCFLLGHVL